jgi:hypothetical protein
MQNVTKFLAGKFSLHIGNIALPMSYVQAAVIIGLIFIFILLAAQLRRHFMDWSVKGVVVGLFFGFLLTLVLEGFLLVGGRTARTGFLGWKNPPPVLSNALDIGKDKLITVLGVKDQIPMSFAKETVGVEGAVNTLQSLNPGDLKKVKAILCQ